MENNFEKRKIKALKEENVDLRKEIRKGRWRLNRPAKMLAGLFGALAVLHGLEKAENRKLRKELEWNLESNSSRIEQLQEDLERTAISYRTVVGNVLVDDGGYEKYRFDLTDGHPRNNPLFCDADVGRGSRNMEDKDRYVHDAEDLVRCVDGGGVVKEEGTQRP